MRKYLLLFFITLLSLSASAQLYLLTGKITNQQNKSLAFATVYIRNSTYGTSANENGNYQFKLGAGTYNIVYRFPGYRELTEKITIAGQDLQHNIKMVDEEYQLQQFSKIKGNVSDSAIDIIQQVINKRRFYLKQVKAYTCVVYIKGVQKLVSAPKSLMGKNVTAALNVDSNGKGILYQTESLSNYSFEQPNKVKEDMIATKSAGQNTSFSYNKASDLTVNFYKNIFTVPGLSSHGFISPVADNALSYYHYNLLGSKIENGITVDKIQVIPKKPYGPVFTGIIYIVEGDWRIYGVDLMLTGKANELNLVDTLEVSQQYVPIRDSVWEPLSVQYSFRGDVLGFKFEGYYLGIYNNYNLHVVFPEHHFNGEKMRMDTFATRKDSVYWQKVRPVPLTPQENLDYSKKEEIAALKKSLDYIKSRNDPKNNFYILPYLPFGYKASYKDNKDSIYVFPFIQTLFYNTIEGVGINLKATYSHYYNDYSSFNITPNLRYGTADKLLNANVRGTYTYDPFNRGKFFGGFGSDLLDLSNVGTRSLYFNTLSTLLSEQNYVKYYRSEFGELGYQHDLTPGILWSADINYANRTQLYNNSFYSINTYKGRHLTSNNPLMPDAPANDRSLLFPQNQALTFSTSFTITFDQQYDDKPTGRTYEPSPYPQVKVNYRKGINSVFGSDVNYDFGSLEIYHEHLTTGITGFSAFKITAGDFFNHSRLYFMDYNHFLGNQGTTFDPTPGSFHFLPFYTYSTDGPFLEAHYEHNFTGYLFNNISFLRKLKLDEIIGANYLSENNNRNYSEFYIGIQRLIFRVDYGFAFEGNHKYTQGFKIFYGIR
ncbi:MAG: carboxypeptidase-like regulatory protein [Mucilaginibacter sp.]|nr:carboxypeptidase-like regulatory protein [Mucilaginibacter sp.]